MPRASRPWGRPRVHQRARCVLELRHTVLMYLDLRRGTCSSDNRVSTLRRLSGPVATVAAMGSARAWPPEGQTAALLHERTGSRVQITPERDCCVLPW